MELTGIIVAVISLIGTLSLGFFQLRVNKTLAKKQKSEADKLDMEAIGLLIDKAMGLNIQELNTIRTMNDLLKKENEELKKESTELRKRIEILEKEKLVSLDFEQELKLSLRIQSEEIEDLKLSLAKCKDRLDLV